jgi:DNA-directed RNA polymerase specialized sigma24 family protein
MTANEVVAEFRKIKEEYAWHPYDFEGRNDDPRVARLKEIIATRLNQVDRTLLLLYCEYGSYRKLAKILGVSHMTCRREILRIRKEIMEIYGDMH